MQVSQFDVRDVYVYRYAPGAEAPHMEQFNVVIMESAYIVHNMLGVFANGTLLNKTRHEHFKVPPKLYKQSLRTYERLLDDYGHN